MHFLLNTCMHGAKFHFKYVGMETRQRLKHAETIKAEMKTYGTSQYLT